MVEQGVQNQQLSLFDTAEEQKFAGLAISFSEEDNYLMVASQELPAEKLKQDLLERQELYAADLKPALAAFDLHDVPEEMRTRFFDRTIAAYLLNPLKGAYPYEDIAKDYLGLMIPSRTDLLGKQMPGMSSRKRKRMCSGMPAGNLILHGNQPQFLRKDLRNMGWSS